MVLGENEAVWGIAAFAIPLILSAAFRMKRRSKGTCTATHQNAMRPISTLMPLVMTKYSKGWKERSTKSLIVGVISQRCAHMSLLLLAAWGQSLQLTLTFLSEGWRKSIYSSPAISRCICGKVAQRYAIPSVPGVWLARDLGSHDDSLMLYPVCSSGGVPLLVS